MQELKQHCTIGLVGGSDLAKIAEQMKGMSVLEKYTYVFSENGLVAHKNGQMIHRKAIKYKCVGGGVSKSFHVVTIMSK